jgi:hypothetical protein
VKMVCQKSRDRQQGPQKQRSLPPKKRSIPEAAPSTSYCIPHRVLPSIIVSVDPAATARSNYRSAQVAAPISADDRSIGNSSTTSQTSSFGSSIAANNNNKYIVAVKIKSALAPTATTVPVAMVNSKTMKTNSSKSSGSPGVMPFISNDSKFVAATLKRRESLEVYRAAKAMLYDAYMKAVNEKPR